MVGIGKVMVAFLPLAICKFCVTEPKNQWKIGMYTLENGFEMNDEMAAWLKDKPELEVHVVTN